MKNLIGVFALSFALLGACATSSDPVATSDEEQAVIDDPNACCSWGSFTCASNGRTFDYDPPGCDTLTKPRARSFCQAACGGVPCVDSGWFSQCVQGEAP